MCSFPDIVYIDINEPWCVEVAYVQSSLTQVSPVYSDLVDLVDENGKLQGVRICDFLHDHSDSPTESQIGITYDLPREYECCQASLVRPQRD